MSLFLAFHLIQIKSWDPNRYLYSSTQKGSSL
ncbi:hypothetical protein CYA_1141 [Synechococcus sp. JA-3-3Ab]|nr:hypothetical protein CYA_1141 [Synechococcus sp. JA-3-3Ab]